MRWLATTVAVIAASVLGPGAAGASITPAGTLAPTETQNGLGLESPAVAGNTLAVGADATVGANQRQGAVYVFTKGPSGWSNGTDVAELTASDGVAGDDLGYGLPDQFNSVAISGRTIVAGSPWNGTPPAPDTLPPGAAYVFQEPAGGWSGTLHQAAKLVPPSVWGCGMVSSVAVSGATVATNCDSSSLLVFTRPPGGWSGTVQPAARLVSPAGRWVACGCAIDGNTIIAASRDGAYVFDEPAGGWSGSVGPSATLRTPVAGATLTVAGGSVFVGPPASATNSGGEAAVYVFTAEPRRWAGMVRASSTLLYVPAGHTDGAYGPYLAAAGPILAVGDLADGGPEGCPCETGLDVFLKPPDGWSGMRQPDSTSSSVGSPSPTLATDGHTIFEHGTNGLLLFVERPAHLATSGSSVDGLALGRPSIAFGLRASSTSPPLRSLTLQLPPGLNFNAHRRLLSRGVRVVGTGYELTRLDGQLTLSFRRTTLRVTNVVIRSPALDESRLLRTRASHAHALRLALRLVATYLDGSRSSIIVTLRPHRTR